MAIRNIREIGDEVLRKKSKEVKEMTPQLRSVVDDMLETLYQVGGVGLAGPQVGILKRVVVMDVSEEQNDPVVLINPEILETSGSQTGMEGCLSVPGKHAQVTRPSYVKVRAQNVEMEPIELEATDLLARCVLHECDHLDGILYVDKKDGPLLDNEAEEEE
ncbi:MAG: peptide deformylase [Lachnospiraceae bacterium]|nr:peptide deformylase [Lachnospiraceae bacterium]